MWQRLKRWWAADGDAQHLLQLDDRLLADMGLEREGLRRRVMGRDEGEEAEIAFPATIPDLATCTCR